MAYGDGRGGTAATQITPANGILLQKPAGANHAVHRTANGRQALIQPLAGAVWLEDLGTAPQTAFLRGQPSPGLSLSTIVLAVIHFPVITLSL